jgi:hypothetical protein
MSWLDSFFNAGYRTVLIAGVAFPPRPAVNFVGMTGADNPALNRTDITVVVPPNRAPFGPASALVTPPDVSAFTLQNPVSGGVGSPSAATIQNHASGYGVVVYGTQSSAHECFNGCFVTRGSLTTLIMQVDAPYWDTSPTGDPAGVVAPPFGGLIIYSPANHKAIIWGPYAGNAPAAGQGSGIFLFHQDIAGASTTAPFSFVPGRSTFPLWLKWHDDGVNYNFSYSFDGDFTHAPTVAESRTTFLADAGTQIGFGCNSNQGTGTRTNVRSASLWLGSWSPA